MPPVSVIIPTYNRSWGLIRAVKGVLNQSFENFELVIVDDYSPDNTQEVVQGFDDSRIRYFRQPQNVGLAENWGTGLKLAQGEFVTFLMDDDFYKADFLKNRIQHLDHHEDLSVVFSSYDRCDLNENIISQNIPPLEDGGVLAAPEMLEAMLNQYWFAGASMYRKSAVLPVWDLASRDKYVVDYSLAIYLALAGSRGLYINTCDFLVSCHEGQIGQANLGEMLQQTQQTLARIITEPQAASHVGLLQRHLSNLKVIQARYLDLAVDKNLQQARHLILDAVKVDLSNVWAWKQLSKLALLGKL